MKSRQYTDNTGLLGGAVLIMLGFVFFFATTGLFGLDWGNFWPVFLTIAGLCFIVAAFMAQPGNRPGYVVVGVILILLSMFFFATTLEMGITWSDQGVLWPVYPLIFGVALLAGYVASGWERVGFLVTGAIMTVLSGILLVLTGTNWLYSFFDNFPITFRFLDDWGWADFANMWWPAILIAFGLMLVGLALLPGSTRARGGLVFTGTMLLMLGIFFQLTTTSFLSWSDQGRLWPVYLIIFGLSLLASRVASPKTNRL